MTKRFSSLLLLFVLFISLSVSAFAYWNLLNKEDNINIDIGQGTELYVSVATYSNNKQLVPVGQVLWADTQTDEITISYSVNLIGYTSTSNLILNVAAEDILIGGESTHKILVLITYNYVPTVNSPIQSVIITVKLGMPTESEYHAIKNQDITFKLVFTATAG